MRIGMRVRSPFHGDGIVKELNAQTARVEFSEGLKTVAPETGDLEFADPQTEITGMTMPLAQIIRETVEAAIEELGIAPPEDVSVEMGKKWEGGELALRPEDPTLQGKEMPIDTFFHKIVMMRNNLRVLEQKINGHPSLSEGERVELQQYITRCYGSMTTFNVLFRDKASQFRSA